MPVDLISRAERDAAMAASIEMAWAVVGIEGGYLNPKLRLGDMSGFEWNKLAEAFISGWICERSRQLTTERLTDEASLLATGEVPEPQELGAMSVALPALGGFCEKMKLTDKPIGEWSKDNILHFIWEARRLIDEIETAVAERPSILTSKQVGIAEDLLMGG